MGLSECLSDEIIFDVVFGFVVIGDDVFFPAFLGLDVICLIGNHGLQEDGLFFCGSFLCDSRRSGG